MTQLLFSLLVGVYAANMARAKENTLVLRFLSFPVIY